LSITKAIEIVEEAHKMYGRGTVSNPSKLTMFLDIFGKPRIAYVAQPAYIESINRAGVKWSAINHDNPKKGYPSIIQFIILNDGETMRPLAVMEGQWITGIRTAASAAVGIKYLGKKDASNLASIGAGYQSTFQLRAINEVIKIDNVFINDIQREKSERFAKEMSNELGLNVESVDTVEDAIKKSDIICLITSAAEPIMKYDWLSKGTLVCAQAIDSQCDFVTVKQADKIVVDHLDQTMVMGETTQWMVKGYIKYRDIYAEIGEIVSGKKPGREEHDEIILYTPIGMGVLDVATAHWVYENAQKKRLGVTLDYY